MYTEDELLPISALQHLAFCERQWALIHLEQAWNENLFTAEGRQLHDKTHGAGSEIRSGVRIARGLRLRSLRLGLSGMADVVEFHLVSQSGPHAEDPDLPDCVRLDGASGLWRAYPVEYKRGKPKSGKCDEVQLCAQALCLEEMLNIQVPEGALFYGKPRRRHEVVFDGGLRSKTERLAARLHGATAAGTTPPAEYSKKCRKCSLLSFCMPKSAGRSKSARRYLALALSKYTEDEP